MSAVAHYADSSRTFPEVREVPNSDIVSKVARPILLNVLSFGSTAGPSLASKEDRRWSASSSLAADLRVPLSDASIVQSACLARSLSSPKRALSFFQRCCMEIPDEAWAKPSAAISLSAQRPANAL